LSVPENPEEFIQSIRAEMIAGLKAANQIWAKNAKFIFITPVEASGG